MGSSFQEDFCEHIEDTYYSVFPSQQTSGSAKEIADVVHRLMKTNEICTWIWKRYVLRAKFVAIIISH